LSTGFGGFFPTAIPGKAFGTFTAATALQAISFSKAYPHTENLFSLQGPLGFLGPRKALLFSRGQFGVIASFKKSRTRTKISFIHGLPGFAATSDKPSRHDHGGRNFRFF